MQNFNKGDKVQFTTKYNDTLIGEYQGVETVPGAKGDIRVHSVKAQAFPPDAMLVNCLVFDGHLTKVE